MLDVLQREDGRWVATISGQEHGPFDSEDDAWAWADVNVDDQLTGSPNTLVDDYTGGGE